MDSEGILRKFLTPARGVAIIGYVLLALCLVALVLGITANGAEEPQAAVPFSPLEERTGDYCYLDIVAVSDWLYNYDGSIYYTAFDADGYMYTVRLSDKQFEDMTVQYDYFVNAEENDPLPAPYRLYGMSQKTTDNIADAVCSAWGADQADYYEYFGNLFLNGTTTPAEEKGAVWFLAALFAFLFGLMLAGMGVNANRIAKKSIRRLEERGELDAAAAELEDPSNETFLKGALRLGEHYVFSKNTGAAFRYEDILWCYTRVTRSGLIKMSTSVIANTATTKNIALAAIVRGKEAEEVIEAVMATLAEKNPNVLLGFTNENRKAYKAIVNGER